MKVTALISDELVSEVRELTGGSNITESLVLALTDWLHIQKLKAISNSLEESPLDFQKGFDAETVREQNRSR